jgi:hypothetical protein
MMKLREIKIGQFDSRFLYGTDCVGSNEVWSIWVRLGWVSSSQTWTCRIRFDRIGLGYSGRTT